MRFSSIPDGRDFEIALRYLDDDLPESEQMLFELRLSEDPELAEQFQRLATLDMAQRRLAEIGGAEERIPDTGRTALLLPRRDDADGSRTTGMAQLALAASLLLFGGAVAWRLLGRPSRGGAEPTTVGTNSNGVDKRGTLRSATDPGGLPPIDSTVSTGSPRLFMVGFPLEGGPKRFLLPDATAAPPAPADASQPVYRRKGESSAGQQVDDDIQHGHVTMPAGAETMSVLIVGFSPHDDPEFFALLDARLARTETATESEILRWLRAVQGVDVSVFSVGE